MGGEAATMTMSRGVALHTEKSDELFCPDQGDLDRIDLNEIGEGESYELRIREKNQKQSQVGVHSQVGVAV
jgi:hypothetical protein